MDVFRFLPGYHEWVYDEGKEPLFLLVLAFLVAFSLARGYTRLARTRGWGSGAVHGVHLHHVVPGIVLVLGAGLLAFSRGGTDPVLRGVGGILFGVGAALVLDEFALMFYLRDVYWTAEGRGSVDAAVLGAMIAGLSLVVSEPFGIDDRPLPLGRAVFFGVIAVNVLFALVTFVKGKRFTGFAAIFLPAVGLIGALRLAKPLSPWAHRFYGANRLARAERRAETGLAARFQRRLLDLVGGEPNPPATSG